MLPLPLRRGVVLALLSAAVVGIIIALGAGTVPRESQERRAGSVNFQSLLGGQWTDHDAGEVELADDGRQLDQVAPEPSA